MNRVPLLMLCTLLALPLVPTQAAVSLKGGLNLVSFTTEPAPALTSHQMGTVIGAALIAFSRLDAAGGVIEKTTFGGSGASGPDFPVVPGEGYLIEMDADAEVTLAGAEAAAVTVDLVAGLNLVGFHPVGAVFRAHDLLRRLGDPDVVTSVGRFDRDSGRFVTATQSADGPSGPNFVIRAGDGLLIAMRQPVTGFSVPGVGFGSVSEHFAILRSALSGGGGASGSAGGFTLFSSIAQPGPIGASSSASYRLSGGFLAGFPPR